MAFKKQDSQYLMNEEGELVRKRINVYRDKLQLEAKFQEIFPYLHPLPKNERGYRMPIAIRDSQSSC